MTKIRRSPKARRLRRIRAKIRGTKARPRLNIFRSNKYIYAQIIDDETGETLVAASEKDLAKPGSKPQTKTERASALGEMLAKKALKKGIKKLAFDRGSYKYHGRIKALAEAARNGGLVF